MEPVDVAVNTLNRVHNQRSWRLLRCGLPDCRSLPTEEIGDEEGYPILSDMCLFSAILRLACASASRLVLARSIQARSLSTLR